MNYISKAGLAILIGLPTIFLTGCLNDEEDFTGSIEASDQIVAQNNIFVDELSINHRGWLAMHRSIGGTPGELLSTAYINSAGRFSNNFIPFDSSASISDGMEIILMLHNDTGVPGEFEFTSGGSLDQPVEVNGQVVMKTITINAPFVTIPDQEVDNNSITIEEVQTGLRAWVAVYKVDDEGNLGSLAGYEPINESPATDVEVELSDSLTYEAGNSLAVRLHVNNADDFSADPAKLNYPQGNDEPQVFGFEDDNEIITIFTLQ